MRFGLLTLAALGAMASTARAEPAAYPAARILRPLTLPGSGLSAAGVFRFDDALSNDQVTAALAWGVVDQLELRGALVSDSAEAGAALALDDGRGAVNLAVEAATSFGDIPLVAGLHARVRLRDIWLRLPPDQLTILRGGGETDVIGRLPLAFGLQAAPRLAIECELAVYERSRMLGGRALWIDQLELGTTAWLSLPLSRVIVDVGARVDADPLHGSTGDIRYWLVLHLLRPGGR